MMKFVIIGMGGFVGAILRYSLSTIVVKYSSLSQFWGTMVVNIVGCLILGVILQLIELRGFIKPELRIFLIIGLLGSFTTFSAFAHETFTMMKSAQYWSLVFNVSTQLILGVTALWFGMLLGRGMKL